MTVILVTSFVAIFAPALAGLVWMFDRSADAQPADELSGVRSFLERQSSRH
jgi:hypothetical protein